MSTSEDHPEQTSPAATAYPQPTPYSHIDPHLQSSYNPSQPPYPQSYGQTRYGYPPSGQPVGTNGLAVASLITSLTGIFTCGLGAIVGLILGIIALKQTRETRQDGHGLALAGVIIGGVILTLIIAYLAFLVALGISSSYPH
ncbi:MAG: DUF4190 domain-containing protein [Mycobacteriaceae bacterium]